MELLFLILVIHTIATGIIGIIGIFTTDYEEFNDTLYNVFITLIVITAILLVAYLSGLWINIHIIN